jgi:hypothetical protein
MAGGNLFQKQAEARGTPRAGVAANDPELKALISDADGVPPEFKADILLSLVESGGVADTRLKKTLVNRAYTAADAVQPPYGEGPFGRVGATHTGRKAIALRMTQLDRMSLQSRAVRDMQALSPSRARAMFEEMQFPVLSPLSCDDDWIYDPSAFYSILAEVAEKDFGASEISGGKRLAFLLPYVNHLGSQAQVIPVAHLLTTMKLTAEELRQLVPAYEDALLTAPQDPLTFAVIADEDDGEYVRGAYGERSLSDAMSALASTIRRSAIPAGPLLRSLRAYLVENFNGPRCNTDEKGARRKSPLPSAVAGFNHTFDELLKENGLAPISPSELTKAAVLPTVAFNPPASSFEDQQLTHAIQELHSSRDRSMKDGQVDSSWWRELDDFLSRFYSWNQGEEPEEDYVQAKAEFYIALLDLIPKSPERYKVLESFIGFLERYSYSGRAGAEWLVNAKILLHGGLNETYSRDPALTNALLNSRDPALSLYARLEIWKAKASGIAQAPAH